MDPAIDDPCPEIEALRRELAELRAEMDDMRSRWTADQMRSTTTSTTRRDLLARGGLAAAAGVAGAVMIPHSAAAAPGDAIVQDGSTTGVGSTVVSSSGPEADALHGRATSGTGTAWGVRGESESSEGAGVAGIASATSGTPAGVYGVTDSPDGTGVRGAHISTTGGGAGVVASTASPDGTAVVASATSGIGGAFAGGHAALRLAPSGPDPRIVSSGRVRAPGEVFFDDDGRLWIWSGPAGWRELTSLPDNGFRPIPGFRAYDSRFADGRLAVGRSREIDVSRQIDVATGGVVDSEALGAHVGAISFNLTITDTVEFGFLSVSASTAPVTTSAANWTRSGDTVANGSFTALTNDQTVIVKAGGAFSGATNLIVDVTGVYVGDPMVTVTRS